MLKRAAGGVEAFQTLITKSSLSKGVQPSIWLERHRMVGLPSRAEMLHWWGVSEIGLALMAYVFAVVGPSGFHMPLAAWSRVGSK